MSEIVKTAIEAELATLTRIEPTPVEPFGYGVDTYGVSDWTDTLDEVDPFSVVGIAHALLRRLQTPRGTLADDRNYGLDIRAYVNRPTTNDELRVIDRNVRGEVMKDDRVADAAVAATYAANVLRVQIDCTPEDPSVGPFTLTLAVVDGALLLETINAAA